jgi:hypothetical protein
MPENKSKQNESSAPNVLVERQTNPTVLVVGRNKSVTDEEFELRDKMQDREAAEVWSIMKMLFADQ